ncbi:hypothetical protein M1413_04180 [Patescibacteria group bacterium]|nr:hypothetical protein [Patescibacteria group bacterium]MCL5114901.1 hypothetical protein [Patescibacteria group bacterium]
MNESASSTTNVLITLADKNFIPQAKQLFSSAYWNGGWQGDFLLLAHEDVPEGELTWFEEKGILIYRCKALTNLPRYGRVPAAALDKFYLFTPFFRRWRKIIFLDADVMVRGSLEYLERCEGFSAAPDDYSGRLWHEFKRPHLPLWRNYNLGSSVFNSGVLVIDTRSVIREETFGELKQLSERYAPQIRYGEQAIFNLHWLGTWNRLPRAENFLANFGPFQLMKRDDIRAAVVHLASQYKPWDPRSRFHEEWLTNLEKADAIDLRSIPDPAMTVTEAEMRKFDAVLRQRKITRIYQRATIFFKIRAFVKWKILRKIGAILCKTADATKQTRDRLVDRSKYRIGRFIKFFSPRLYRKLGGKN